MIKSMYKHIKKEKIAIKFLGKMSHWIKNNKKKFYLIIICFCFLILLKSWLIKQDETRYLEIGGPKITLDSSQSKSAKKKSKPKITKTNESIVQLDNSDKNIISTWKNTQWKPVETKQEEPHYTNFNSDSTDRIEMKQAFSNALAIEDKLIEEWWLDSVSSNEIVGYLSNKSTDQYFKVHLRWLKDKGWQPTVASELIKLPDTY